MFEGIVGYQFFIVLTLLGCRVIFPKSLLAVAIGWSLLSIVNIFWPPLMVLQLVVVWVTYSIVEKNSNSVGMADKILSASGSVVTGKSAASTKIAAPLHQNQPLSVINSARQSSNSVFRSIATSLDADQSQVVGHFSQQTLVIPAVDAAPIVTSKASNNLVTERRNSRMSFDSFPPGYAEALEEIYSNWDREPSQKSVKLTKPTASEPMSEDNNVSDLLQRRGVSELLHFTNAENLKSILTDGLLPVEELDRQQRRFRRNDLLRLDKRPDAISLSVSFPNYRMFWKYRKENVSADWVVLILDPALLIKHDCAYCCLNAADHRMRCLPDESLADAAAFQALFGVAEGGTRSESLRKCDPTDSQAEILVFGQIVPNFIKSVVFETDQVRDCYADLIQDIISEVEPAYFLAREVALKRERFRGPASRLHS